MIDAEEMLIGFNKFARDKTLLEDQIGQCDVLIEDLRGTIVLFTQHEASKEEIAIHMSVTAELAYYTCKRIELVENLAAIVDPLPSLTQVPSIPIDLLEDNE